MEKKRMLEQIKKYGVITVACAIYAFGYTCFLDPNLLAPGGVSGLAVILARFLPVDNGVIILCLNIPLLIAGAVVFGRTFIVSTIYATVVSSLMISACSFLPPAFLPVTDDLLTAGLAGGILTAIGMGLIFRCGATTGGTDIIVRLIHRKAPYIKSGAIFLIVDSTVVALSALVFGNINIALYAAISLYANSRLFDVVLYGANTARLMLIITARPDEVVEQATHLLDVGVTVIEARGGYTGSENTMLVCAVKKRLFPRLRKLVQKVDPAAFMIVSSADEIYGEGFVRTVPED